MMFSQRYINYSALLLAFICSVNFHQRSAAQQIQMNVVVTFEKSNVIAKQVFDRMFEWYVIDLLINVKVNYTGIVIVPDDTEATVCQKILDCQPTILIDTNRRPTSVPGNKGALLVKKIARKLGIPTISATYGKVKTIEEWEDLDNFELEYLVEMPPPGYIITNIVRDLALQQNMTITGILYDKSVELDQKYSTLLENVATSSSILKAEPTMKKVEEQLKNMKTSNTAYYFILGTTETMNNALRVAESNGLTGTEYAWFLISTDKKEPSCNCMNYTVLWGSPQPAPGSADKLDSLMKDFQFPSEVTVAFYYDLIMMTITAVSQEIQKGTWTPIKYPACNNRKKVDPSTRNNYKLLSALAQLSYQGLYGPFRFRKGAINYQELELHLRRINFFHGESKKQLLARWVYKPNDQPPGPPTTMRSGNLIGFGEYNLNEFTAETIYRVTTLPIPPFVLRNVNENGTIYFTGYCVDLLDAIKEILDFKYTIFETPEAKFGTMKDDETWDGMMQDLITKKAEIALGPISVMAERETVVDFTVPYYDLVGLSILVKKPAAQSSLFKFLTVLETNVWACILAAYFVTSFLMYVFDRLSPYSYFNNKEKYKDDDDDEKRDFSLKESLWFCMTSLTPQGGGEAPRNLSGRLVAATWWLFGFIIIASYTANLAAFLTVSRLDSPIESLDDLAKQYKIKYAPQAGTSAATYFERMAYIEDKFYEIWKNMSLDDNMSEVERAKLAVWDYPVSDKYTKIWWTMIETGLPKTFEEGVEKVLASTGTQKGFAFIADSTQVKYAIMTHCELTSIGSEFSRKPLALAVQQGSPLKDQISTAILKLLNQRKLESLKETWWNKNPAKVECDDNEQQSDGISIANIGGVFIVIFIGVLMACITLAVEYFFFKNKKDQSTRVVTVDKFPRQKSRRQ